MSKQHDNCRYFMYFIFKDVLIKNHGVDDWISRWSVPDGGHWRKTFSYPIFHLRIISIKWQLFSVADDVAYYGVTQS